MHIAFQMLLQDCWSLCIFVFVCLSVVMLMMNASQCTTISEAGNQLVGVTNKDIRHSELGSCYDTFAVKIVFIVK